MSIKVVKFGGTSMADAKSIRQVAEIIKQDKERRYVVVSAPGKRFSQDHKVTDMLYACYHDTRHKDCNGIVFFGYVEQMLVAMYIVYHHRPARYALCELVNLHDESLQFQPIHRAVFNVGDEFLP